jgi:hypothetical protein
MPIINSYPQDIDIRDKDAWVGTDFATKRTKQYTAEAVANYLNTNGKVSIAGQIAYKFVDNPFGGQGTMALSPNNGTSFSVITGFKISKDNLTAKPVVAYLEFLVEQEILIVNQNDPESFGHYTIDTYAVDPTNNQYYDLTLSFLGGNGSVKIDDFYDIVNFSFAGDKTFTFTQANPSTTWNIQHNLNKFPSVSVVNNNNVLMYGETAYIDKNNLTITFSASFSGKAYLN